MLDNKQIITVRMEPNSYLFDLSYANNINDHFLRLSRSSRISLISFEISVRGACYKYTDNILRPFA